MFDLFPFSLLSLHLLLARPSSSSSLLIHGRLHLRHVVRMLGACSCRAAGRPLPDGDQARLGGTIAPGVCLVHWRPLRRVEGGGGGARGQEGGDRGRRAVKAGPVEGGVALGVRGRGVLCCLFGREND